MGQREEKSVRNLREGPAVSGRLTLLNRHGQLCGVGADFGSGVAAVSTQLKGGRPVAKGLYVPYMFY